MKIISPPVLYLVLSYVAALSTVQVRAQVVGSQYEEWWVHQHCGGLVLEEEDFDRYGTERSMHGV